MRIVGGGDRRCYDTLPSTSHSKRRAVVMSSFHRVPTESTDTTVNCTVDGTTTDSSNDTEEEHDASNSTAMHTTRIWRLLQERRTSNSNEEQLNEVVLSPSNHWVTLACGQFIALAAASTNAASYTLSSRYNVDTQFFQLFLMYNLLSIHLIWKKPIEASVSRVAEQTDGILETEPHYRLPFTSITLRVPWWIYFLMSVFDVFPNYLALFSFHYTSLTSTTLLGSLATPATMLFSRFILARTYKAYHYLGVALCLLGGSITILVDFDDSTTKAHSYIGDLLAVAAALLYGFGDTAAEFFVKHVDRCEYVGMLGVFGAIITGFSFPFFEIPAITGISEMETAEKVEVCGVMVWYILSVFLVLCH